MLLQYLGETLSTSSKIVKSKLLAIDPTTKALLVKFSSQLPSNIIDPVFDTFRVLENFKAGTGANYLEIDSSGYLNLYEDAEVVIHLRPQLQQEEIRKVNKPVGTNVGIFYAYIMPIYAADNQELFLHERIPYRWNGTSDIHVHVLVALSGFEPLPANFRFRLDWEFADSYATDAALPITSNTLRIQTAVVAEKAAQYSLYELNFDIDYDIDGAGNEIKAGGMLAVRILREAADDNEIVNEMLFVDATTHYHTNKIGRSVAEEAAGHF
ncbi:hypothetical protein ES703_118783 [subsurface metagenome]